jgi:hypothetical protein
MFDWFRPRHTVGSVARELFEGLATGTVRLRPPAGPDADLGVPVPPVNGTAGSPTQDHGPAEQPSRAVTDPSTSAP